MNLRLYKKLPWTNDSFTFQFILSFIVGSIAFIVDFSILYLAKELVGFHYLIAASFGFFFGAVANYLLSIYWVFNYRSVDNRYVEFFIFILIGIIGLFLNATIIYFLTEKFGIFYLFSKVLSTITIFLFNFSARKAFLFTKSYVNQRAYL